MENKLTKQFIPYQFAFRMKALGYEEPCFNLYNFKTKELMYAIPHVGEVGTYKYANHNKTIHISAPTWQSAFEWFREKHTLEGICSRADDFKWYKFNIFFYLQDSKKWVDGCYEFNSYNEAKIACLEKLCEIVEKRKEYGIK